MKVYVLVVENHGSSDGPFMLKVYNTRALAHEAARVYAKAEEKQLIEDHDMPIGRLEIHERAGERGFMVYDSSYDVTEHELEDVMPEDGEIDYNWGQFR